MHTLLRRPRLQSHALTSVRTLKIPNAGSITHRHTAHTDSSKTGSVALAAAVPYPGKATRIAHRGQ